jgi:two-component system response regulator WspF
VNAEPLVRKIQAVGVIAGIGRAAPPPTAPPAPPADVRRIAPFVAIGASTGGPQALATVLRSFPTSTQCPVVIVQHIDPTFAPGLAGWLSQETGRRVEVARPGDTPAPKRILLASTSEQLYRPSVDVFFDSIARARAAPGVAALLTGMGRDGALGLARLRASGWHTIAQDKATSVVWGMPGAAVEIGAAVESLPIDLIGSAIAARMTAAPLQGTP